MPYAKGKYALGVCDRTGFVYKLKDLRNQIVDQRRTGLMVGKDVLDKDQPQYQIGRLNVDDPQGLRNARPQKDLEQTRGTYAWDPIGGWNSAYGASNLNNMVLYGHVGKLKITTD
tara:strand:+ start:883 stop:1227 length:345 start_codon:yes stop_codon:yes gene_type:complete